MARPLTLDDMIVGVGSQFPPQGDQPAPASAIWTPASPNFSTANLLCNIATNSSGAWFSANDPILIPFVVNDPVTVYQLGWFNGSAAGDSVDVGIYNTSFARLISTGSQTGTGNSTYQFIDVADTVLTPGYYYAAMVMSTTTANRCNFFNTNLVSALAMAGVLDSSTDALPLPDPITNMAAAATAVSVPVLFIATRTVV